MESSTMDNQEAMKILMNSKEQALASRQAFFETWKEGVKLAGVRFFGDGSLEGYEKSRVINDLRPNKSVVEESFDYLSPGEKAFLSSLYSFFNSNVAADFCRTANVKSVGDLSILDANRRKVIGNLLIHYSGW